MKRLVIGILAHVDSGKTTLSEGMLYTAGNLKKLGRVDHGDAFLDSYALERERGITIFSKQAVLRLEDAALTLLDTPGHVDFSPEMERALQVLDYAILVISGTDGVQSHTETLWQLLRRHRIPTFLFINKMDLAGADRAALLAQLRRRLADGCTDFGADQPPETFAEALALCDETLLETFLDTGAIAPADICAAVAARKIFPCFFGSALKLQGVDAFLAGLAQYTLAPPPRGTFSAKVFKIGRDDADTRLTYLKITGGSLAVKTPLQGISQDGTPWSEKVNQIRLYSGAKFQAMDEALPGMVCAVTGLSHTRAGDALGGEAASDMPRLAPVLTYRVDVPPEIDAHEALVRLRLLEEEEPQLHVVWREALQQIHVQLMGEVQLEVLSRLILERFGMQVHFGQGGIIYKETIANEVEGVGHFEPLRHYAEVHLLLTPAPRGSGLSFGTACSEDVLDRNWQRLIVSHLEEKMHVGVLTGSAVTDLRITLVAGRGHEKHTEGGDFREATYRAVRQGLRQAHSVLLEPWYRFRLEVPTENVGRAMSDLQRMHAVFAPPETADALSVLTGTAPVATLRDYQTEVIAYTRGHGRLSCMPDGYQPCHNTAEVIAAIGYDCDGDTENTADSVFCAHGAGFTVKWNEALSQMHVAAYLQPEKPADKPVPPATMRRAAAYCGTLAEDAELLAIYERTYGPVRRNPRDAFRSVRSEAPQVIAPPPRTGAEYLLVDGYNIIFAWDELAALAREDLDAARQQLINILCNFRAFRQCELILVFDAYKVKGNPGELEQRLGMSIVYTKEAETADMYIEKVTHALAKTRRVRVATSDSLEQLIILGHGALRMPAEELREEVEQARQAMRCFLE